jgi:HrpA-like RNA helicase
MAILPTEPIYSKLLITSLKRDYIDLRESISAIVAMLSVENIFYTPKGQDKDVRKKRKKFANSESDHLTLLNVFNLFKNCLKTKSKKEAVIFARDHYLNDKSLLKAV